MQKLRNTYARIRSILKRTLRRTPHDERVALPYKAVKAIHEAHVRITYRGVKANKCPFDYVMYQMMLNTVQPDLVIEIGTDRGGGSLYLADIMDKIGKGTIHTIDIENNSSPLSRSHPRIKFFTEGWANYDPKNAKGFDRILIIEDSSHTYENTLAVMEKFAPLVSNGSYLVVEDGIVDALGGYEDLNGGPCRAIREFLLKHPEFAVDRSYCDMFGKNVTFNVNGYLRCQRSS